MDHFRRQMSLFKGDVHMEYLGEQQLLALQGPGAQAAVQPLLPADIDLDKVPFISGFDTKIAGIEVNIRNMQYAQCLHKHSCRSSDRCFEIPINAQELHKYVPYDHMCTHAWMSAGLPPDALWLHW
jgi:hypothetical protein